MRFIPHINDLNCIFISIVSGCLTDKARYQSGELRIIHTKSRPATTWNICRTSRLYLQSVCCFIQSIFLSFVHPVWCSFRYCINNDRQPCIFRYTDEFIQFRKIKFPGFLLNPVPHCPMFDTCKTKFFHM